MFLGPQRDVLYCEGPGNIVAAFEAWRAGTGVMSETSVTFSSQIFDACRAERVSLYAVSSGAQHAMAHDAAFTVVNMPRWQIGIPKIGYDLSVLLYAFRVALLALRVRPQVILVGGGIEPAFCEILRISGARIVPLLHNTLWPEGFPTLGLKARIVRSAERRFFSRIAVATMAVSPAVARQARSLGAKHVTEFRPSFPSESFSQDCASVDFNQRPFQIVFAGRIERNKGVFDILDMAERLGQGFSFTICGGGSDLERLGQSSKERGLGNVTICGRLNRPALIERYLAAHAVVVPTRSNFAEGYAMVAAEAVLLLRPVITSPVVPASEVLAPAVALARTDDVDSYIQAINRLANDKEYYAELVKGARRLRSVVLDGSSSLLAVTREALRSLACGKSTC
jgi:glycosyltransferase involved in cell wall biosynthesis